ncbi:rRNA maturation RNase YbeY [Nesterenkonia natronophila]|uniref:Endoribonuclease YbeY n=1 Tax=Nesterenkonia natronophila TaxID=2174932 RepID=A0A3A4F764_9MICC|nr:rRNA maturation RNase YbeY [Nesterenkonia natronophila]RJN31107.1 rRNA maturation RNase YbeY [Nesterenkonia natronophila]
MTVTVDDASASPFITAEQCAELVDLAAFLYAELHLAAEVELAVRLVDQQEMEQLHRQWMGFPGPTDVLSFPMDELTQGSAEAPVRTGVLGDVVLCPAVAAAQAHAAGHSVADELLLLTTHGILHLLGYDHHTAGERAEMFGLQAQLLEKYLGRPGPVPTAAEETQA